ncbi:MAG: DUF6443 domain-containing protein, partial [Mucilaginibacter sp.]|uniref:DUF6443 domain-containing protein n=1 Tax=Mucilaginibacter sp. TaxID=1882438 RepID=UPI00326452BC
MLHQYNNFWSGLKLKAICTGVFAVSAVAKVSAPSSYIPAKQPSVVSFSVRENRQTVIGAFSITHKLKVSSKRTLVYTTPFTPACVALGTSPSSDQNYVLTMTPTVPVTDVSSFAPYTTCEMMESIQYLDGIGRPLQTVQVKGNQDASGDLIKPVEYDELGREAKSYLPYVDYTGTSGSYRSNALQSGAGQSYFYNNAPLGVTPIPTPFTETKFDDSPLDRTREQGAPGNAWQLSAGHTKRTEYGVNVSNDVRKYDAILTSANDYHRTLSTSGYYDTGDLYLTIYKDENWASADLKKGTTEEYKDKEGKVILKRKFDSAGLALSTYYVYDFQNKLSFVLTPGTDPDAGSINQAALDNLCYQYLYDGLGRQIEKKLPGRAWEYMLYNANDQLIGTSYAQAGWKYTKYDEFGRVIISGNLYIGYNPGSPGAFSREYLQGLVNQNLNLYETRSTTGAYSNLCWPTISTLSGTGGNIQELIVNYYDDYNIPGVGIDFHPGNSQMTKGSLTASRVLDLYDGDAKWTVNYYDDLGRVTNIYSQHYLGGQGSFDPSANYDHFSNTYNFNNQVQTTTRYHYTTMNGPTTPALTILNTYVYDHLGRKKQTWEQINTPLVTGANVVLSQIDYNDIGQPITKHLHSDDGGASFLQNVAYTYNERGWLNHTHSTLYDQQLRYDVTTRGANSNFNGNVSEQEYTTPYTSSTNWTTYTYDKLNRLISANSTTSYTGMLMNLSETGIQYDQAGNIKQLTRGNNVPIVYTYLNSGKSNQIASVSGMVNSYAMVYDARGNLEMDVRDDKNIEEDHNLLDLPYYTFGDREGPINYMATGEKISDYDYNTGIDREYVKGIVYSSPSSPYLLAVDYIQTEEGRAVPLGNGFKYEYTLKDHLGNTRVCFDNDPSNPGTAREIMEADYYPFGKSQIVFTSGNGTHYLYNGKEKQTTFDEYDYGARYYDPVLARWKSIDPLAEKSRAWSPYNYGFDNPITNIDPDGMQSSRYDEDSQTPEPVKSATS